MKKLYVLVALAIILLALVASACSAPTPAPTPTQTPTPTPTSTPSPTATVGQLASAGQTVFASRCAGCHGQNGEGKTAPAVIGASASLTKYNDAQGLFNYI